MEPSCLLRLRRRSANRSVDRPRRWLWSLVRSATTLHAS